MKLISKCIFAISVALIAILFHPSWRAQAQPIQQVRLTFSPGTSGTVVNGRLQGGQIVDYLVNTRAGQRMVVDMNASNLSTYFNVMPAGNPAAIHIGSSAGNHFDGRLPGSGDWIIRVYLMRNAARRNERTDYQLSVQVGSGGGQAAQPPDYADGNAGGPDFWQVVNVPPGDFLNMRAGPSSNQRIIARFSNGQILRNLGCRQQGNARWCQVETMNGRVRGWVSGRYLRESGAPGSQRPPSNPPSASGYSLDIHIRETGEVEVAWPSGCTVLYNTVGRRIQAGRSCNRRQLQRSDDVALRLKR